MKKICKVFASVLCVSLLASCNEVTRPSNKAEPAEQETSETQYDVIFPSLENASADYDSQLEIITARYDYLLFIDSDMRIGDPLFLSNYLQSPCDTVIDGGVAICGDDKLLKGTLRYLYEKSEEARHTAEQRCQTPYQHLHTANLLIRRDIMLQYPFDERFRHYGYEDVLLGKTLRQHRIAISHIDNPVLFCDFESNPEYVAKTEEGLRTLHQFREDLRGYSRLLTFVGNIHIPIILSTIRLWHHLLGHLERKNLCGTRPCLLVFKLYRLGYFLSL